MKTLDSPSSIRAFLLSVSFQLVMLGWILEPCVFAYETDNFTARQALFAARDSRGQVLDATETLSQMARSRLALAIHNYNASNEDCEIDLDRHRPHLFDELESEFKGYFAVTGSTFSRGTFASGLEKEAEVGKRLSAYRFAPRSVHSKLGLKFKREMNEYLFGQFGLSSSIYDGVDWFITAVGLQESVRMQNNMIGLDKIGHFFSSGLTYFDYAYELNEPSWQYAYFPADANETKTQSSLVIPSSHKKPFREIDYHLNSLKMASAITLGIVEEENYYGLKVSGVKAYGDMAAEFQGLRFWTNVLMGPRPYVSCVAGKYVLNSKHQFDFADYVNPSWDEGINCSEFTSDIERQVRPRINALGGCPIVKEKEKCRFIAKLPCAKFNTSPLCLAEVPVDEVNTFCAQDENTLLTPAVQQSFDSPTRAGYESPQSLNALDRSVRKEWSARQRF